MKSTGIALLCVAALTGPAGLAQSGSVIPQGGAGHAAKASCVILKRMGPADQVTSHMYSFGIRGKQFQYVEGKLPEGFPFHGRMTDHDVRNLQARGAEVIVIDSHYTSDDLKQARAECRGETGTTPNQSEAKDAPPQTAGATSEKPAATTTLPSSAGTAPATELSLSSTPPGADITVDGDFVGNTPSTFDVALGDHTIAVSLDGYRPWERKIHTSGGKITLAATLAKGAGEK